MQSDIVGQAIGQWREEHPDADLAGLELSGRLALAQRALSALSATVLRDQDLEGWEWDVLSALWRARGTPKMMMSELGERLLIAAGSVTNRVQRLEGRGLVQRQTDPASRRRVLVALTTAGVQTVQSTLPAILSASEDLRAELPGIDLDVLNSQLAEVCHLLL